MQLLQPRTGTPWKIIIVQPFVPLVKATTLAARVLGLKAEYVGKDQKDDNVLRYQSRASYHSSCDPVAPFPPVQLPATIPAEPFSFAISSG